MEGSGVPPAAAAAAEVAAPALTAAAMQGEKNDFLLWFFRPLLLCSLPGALGDWTKHHQEIEIVFSREEEVCRSSGSSSSKKGLGSLSEKDFSSLSYLLT